ncbi:hypothetical protein SAMN04487939_12036 [Lysobacter sp. yr284]|uniref:hypothetical protein n=1 Tax=Lysobacter sp. yr284 TaxID=1761791 RepID=UPI000895FF55|nr:hypothetical protein [Lysobacter sp. yr284]SDZ17718.1 hypothetical protein SAMN04487939_12036 [Lysobacter sp. yr284]
MPDSQFPILGTIVPPMLGRAAILERIIGSLTKATPDHLQMVGPRFAGKTVVLHELANQLRRIGSPYSAIVLWDLGHQTPRSDEIFMQNLARELSAALAGSFSVYADHLKNPQGNPYQEIAEVLDLLKDEDVKVLLIMDGFDKPLSNGQLTRNLWDQLRELALKSSLRLITASRRTLRDLIRNPDAQTSDFWNIFDPTPVRVGCFDDRDLGAILATVPAQKLGPGAETELWNASNGFPVLMLGVLNATYGAVTKEAIGPEVINAACNSAFPALLDKLDALWLDCSPSSQDLLRRVLDEDVVSRAGIASGDAETLLERGFVRSAGNKLQGPSRLLRRYLDEQPNEGSALARLFGATDAYQRNLKGVLERRIGAISGIDSTLKRYLERSAEELPDHPDVFLSNVRGIVDKAFDLIWAAEIPNKKIPSGWMSIWKRNNELRVDEWETTFPQGGRRVVLLKLMTGSERSAPCAKYVTKGTHVLLDAVHAFGDFGQHQEGARIDSGMAYAALHLCIELSACLACELPKS